MAVGAGSPRRAEESAPGENGKGSSLMSGTGAQGRSGGGSLNNKNRGLNEERECIKGNGIRLPTFCTAYSIQLELDAGVMSQFPLYANTEMQMQSVRTHILPSAAHDRPGRGNEHT